MKFFFAIFSLLLFATAALCAEPIHNASQFQCADSLSRADGQPRRLQQCQLHKEYCYEATGGAAFSHGAKCLPLPKPGATCKDFVIEPGGSCVGAPSSGIHVGFAFP